MGKKVETGQFKHTGFPRVTSAHFLWLFRRVDTTKKVFSPAVRVCTTPQAGDRNSAQVPFTALCSTGACAAPVRILETLPCGNVALS